jgi:hypothetical protein
VYYVYVIELDDSVGPRLNPKYPNVYVGQSFHPPDKRFAQHLGGVKAAKKVKNHGKWLRRKLYQNYNPIHTRDLALMSPILVCKLGVVAIPAGYREPWGLNPAF